MYNKIIQNFINEKSMSLTLTRVHLKIKMSFTLIKKKQVLRVHNLWPFELSLKLLWLIAGRTVKTMYGKIWRLKRIYSQIWMTSHNNRFFFSRRQYIIKRKSNSFKSNSLKVLFATGEKCLKCLRIISIGGPKKRKKKKPLIVIIPLNKFSCNFA